MKRKLNLVGSLILTLLLLSSCVRIVDPIPDLTGQSAVSSKISGKDQTVPDPTETAPSESVPDEHDRTYPDVFVACRGNANCISNGQMYMSENQLYRRGWDEKLTRLIDGVPYCTDYKMDLETGKLSTLCMDPVCSHSSEPIMEKDMVYTECPFGGGCQIIYIDGDVIYYLSRYPISRRDNDRRTLVACSYDQKTLRHKVLFVLRHGAMDWKGILGYVNGKIYYFVPELLKDRTYDLFIRRYDTKTDEDEAVMKYDHAQSVNASWDEAHVRYENWVTPLFVDDEERIWFRKVEQNYYWGQKENGKYDWIVKEIVKQTEPITFYVSRNGEKPERFGETFENVRGAPKYYNGKLYFAQEYKDADNDLMYTYDVMIRIYSLDCETAESECICQKSYGFFSISNGKLLTFAYSSWFDYIDYLTEVTPDSQRFFDCSSGDVYCIDPDTGETSVMHIAQWEEPYYCLCFGKNLENCDLILYRGKLIVSRAWLLGAVTKSDKGYETNEIKNWTLVYDPETDKTSFLDFYVMSDWEEFARIAYNAQKKYHLYIVDEDI